MTPLSCELLTIELSAMSLQFFQVLLSFPIDVLLGCLEQQMLHQSTTFSLYTMVMVLTSEEFLLSR
jgi:hypothetical protein